MPSLSPRYHPGCTGVMARKHNFAPCAMEFLVRAKGGLRLTCAAARSRVAFMDWVGRANWGGNELGAVALS